MPPDQAATAAPVPRSDIAELQKSMMAINARLDSMLARDQEMETAVAEPPIASVDARPPAQGNANAPTSSYAAAAAKPQQGRTAAPKTKAASSNPLGRNHPAHLIIRVVGGADTAANMPSSRVMRDRINAVLADKTNHAGKKLEVSSLTRTMNGNIVVIAKEGILASELEPFGSEIANAATNKPDCVVHADTAWFKVQVNRVDTRGEYEDMDDDRQTKLPTPQQLMEDIRRYNVGADKWSFAALPRWMGKEENLVQRLRASIVLAFTKEEDAKRLIRDGIQIYAEPLTVTHYADLPKPKACDKCQRLDHQTRECSRPARCGLCAEAHHTNDHSCGVDDCATHATGAVPRLCEHKAAKCALCNEAHKARDDACRMWQKHKPATRKSPAQSKGGAKKTDKSQGAAAPAERAPAAAAKKKPAKARATAPAAPDEDSLRIAIKAIATVFWKDLQGDAEVKNYLIRSAAIKVLTANDGQLDMGLVHNILNSALIPPRWGDDYDQDAPPPRREQDEDLGGYGAPQEELHA